MIFNHKWSPVAPGEVTRSHRSQVEVWRRVEDPEVRAEHGAAGQDGHGAQVARGVAVVGGAEHGDALPVMHHLVPFLLNIT